MEYKTCKTCNNHKPVVQFKAVSSKGSTRYYSKICKFCAKNDSTLSFEKLYTIPRESYLGKICNKCNLSKPNNYFFGKHGCVCKKCITPTKKAALTKYKNSEKGKAMTACSNFKRVETLSKSYIKALYSRAGVEPDDAHIDFKRALILAKRKLNLTHSTKRT